MKTAICALLLIGAAIVAPRPAAAHHAIGGEYDPNKPVTLTGVVTKVDWTNPHARVHFDVKESDGSVSNWSVELAARNVLERMGWTIRSLQAGQTITVRGDAARNGAKMLNARAREQRGIRGDNGGEYPITLADGTPVLNDR